MKFDMKDAVPIDSGVPAKFDMSQAQPIEPEAAPPQKPGMLEPHGGKLSVGDFFRGMGAGVVNIVKHPQQTLAGMAQPFLAAGVAPGGMYPTTAATGRPADLAANRQVQLEAQQGQAEQAKEIAAHPTFAAGTVVGPALATHGLTKVLPRVIGALPESARTALRNVTNTAPSDVAKAVKTASKANEIKTERVADINARRAETHETKVKAIQEQNANAAAHAEEINKSAAETATKKGQLARQVKEQSARLVERVRTVQRATKAKLDKSYAEIRKAAQGQSVPAADLRSAVETAQSKIKGSSESIKQFKDILSKAPEEDGAVEYQGAQIPKGHPLYDVLTEGIEPAGPIAFDDLRGYYSELGEKLAPGNLLPDVYQALKSLQESIGKMQENLATKAGVGAKFKTTQAAFHDYMQTFRESAGPNHSGSPIAAALQAKDPAFAIKPLTAEESAGRVRNMLTRFDPPVNGQGGAGKLFDNFRDVTRQYEGIEEPKGVAKALTTPKPIPTAPKTLEPKLNTLTRESLESVKRENALEAARKMEKSRSTLVSSIAAFDMIRSGVLGEWAHVGLDVVARVLYSAGKQGIARALQHPEIVTRLSKLRPEDYAAIAKLPEAQRTAFVEQIKPVVEAAKAQGIALDPRLLAIGGMAGAQANRPKGVAAAPQPVGAGQDANSQ